MRRASHGDMTPEELRNRTKSFALDVIRFCGKVQADGTRDMTGQLMRAAASVGANYRAVCRARSDVEFIAKLGVAIEEADESAYWLELLTESGLAASTETSALRNEAAELTRILVASRRTAKLNHQSRNRK